MLFFIISIFIIFILISIMPFKITIIYSDKDFNIYIYNFQWKKRRSYKKSKIILIKKQMRKKMIARKKL